MLANWEKCRRKMESTNPRVEKINNNKTIILSSNCSVCGGRKSRFVKDKKTSGLLSSLGIRIRLIQHPIVDPFLFYGH